MRKPYVRERGDTVLDMWVFEWWGLHKTDVSVKEHLRDLFLFPHSLHHDQFLDKSKSGALFGYVECNIKIPDQLKDQFAFSPPVFKKINVCRQDIGPLMQEYAEKEEFLTQMR